MAEFISESSTTDVVIMQRNSFKCCTQEKSKRKRPKLSIFFQTSYTFKTNPNA